MNSLINDPAFGPIEFDYGWCKEDEIVFFGTTYAVEILAEAEMGQPISDKQRSAYTGFCGGIAAFSADALEALRSYYNENLPAIAVHVDDPATLPEEEEVTHSDLIRMVEPKTVFFRQDGIYAVLCDSIWEPQNGLAIIMSDDGLSIDTQDQVL
jgi:hypothetical protein